MSKAVVHLYSNEGYDESEFWCEPGVPAMSPVGPDGKLVEPAREPHKATCLRCLSVAVCYGEAASVRMAEIRREADGN
jgi:hypothetical protein